MGFAQMGHICNQCGWGYPKPHPSAKQRRAHKRVCGKAEEPQDGQDGQGEDEQEVKEGEGAVNGEMGVEVMERQVSGKSEEDVFSDACNEFTDLKGGNGAGSSFRSSDSSIQDSLSGALQMENDAQTEPHSSNSTKDRQAKLITSDTNGSPSDVPKDDHVDDIETFEDVDSHPYVVKDVDTKGNSESNGIPSAPEVLDVQAELITSDTKEANGSPSYVPKDDHVDDIETFEDVDSHPYVVKDVDTKGDSESNGIPSAQEVSSSDTESRESGVVFALQVSESNKTQSDLPDAPGQKMHVNESGGSEKVCESEDSFQVDVDCAIKSRVDHSDNATDGYNAKEVTESLHVLSKPTYMASEEFPKETVTDYEEHVPLSKSGESASMLYLAKRIHEDNRKRMVEEVATKNGADIAEAKDVSEGPELHSADVVVSDRDAVEEIENDEHYTRDGAINRNHIQRKSCPETSSLEMYTTLEPEPHDALQDISLESVPRNFVPVAASDDNVISSEDAVVNDSIDGVKDFPDRDEQYNRGGAEHENSAQRCTDSETSSYRSDLEDCFQETKPSSSIDINDSSAMLINTSQFDNTTESASDSQNLHGENYLKSSKELEPAQAALLGAVEGSAPSTVHTVPAVLNSYSLEDEVLDLGMASDVCSQHFMDTEDFLLEKQLEDLAVGLLDGSGDSFRQTDSHQCASDIKGIQNPQQLHVSSLNTTAEDTGKVSDLTSPKTRAPLKAFLAEPNFDNKQEGAAQVRMQKSPTYKDGAESKALLHDDNGTNTGVDKEWDSPAKLPKHTHRRKSMFLPFLCCSSVN